MKAKSETRSGFLSVQFDNDRVWRIDEKGKTDKSARIQVSDEYRFFIDNFLEDVCAEPLAMPKKGTSTKVWATNISDALFRRYQFS